MSSIGIGISPAFGVLVEDYLAKILNLGPVALWKLNETSGATAENAQGNSDYDGTYVGSPTLNDRLGPGTGIGAPLFDGATQYVDVHSAELAAAFDEEEGTLLAFGRCKEIDQSGTANMIYFYFGTDANNRVMVRQINTADSRIHFRFEGGGTDRSYEHDDHQTSNWTMVTITWSKSGSGKVRFYINDSQVGSDENYPQWSGALADALIGDNSDANSKFIGHLSTVALFDQELSADQISTIYGAISGPPQAFLADFYRMDDSFTDCDFIALADIDDDGETDVVSGQSTGTPAVYWWKNGAAADGKTWTRYTILSGTGTEIEGACAGDFNGDDEVEVITLDQVDGKIRMYKPTVSGTPTGAWTEVELLASRPYLQDAVVWDIDGDGRPEIIYAWEGDGAGVGGINWLDWDSGDVMIPANWTDYSMVQHAGAWWIARTRLDLSGDSNETDIVFSARNSQNPSADPGIFWLEEPSPVTGSWSETTILRDAGKDWTHVDVGDFSGDGSGKDVVAHDNAGTRGIKIFRESDSWSATDVTEAESGTIWNVRTLPHIQVGGRDTFIVAHVDTDIYLYYWNGSTWASAPLGYGNVAHPLDDDIVFYDTNDDGVVEAFIADSASGIYSKLCWIKIAYQ